MGIYSTSAKSVFLTVLRICCRITLGLMHNCVSFTKELGVGECHCKTFNCFALDWILCFSGDGFRYVILTFFFLLRMYWSVAFHRFMPDTWYICVLKRPEITHLPWVNVLLFCHHGHYVERGLMVGMDGVCDGGGCGSGSNVFALPQSQRVLGWVYVCWMRLQT